MIFNSDDNTVMNDTVFSLNPTSSILMRLSKEPIINGRGIDPMDDIEVAVDLLILKSDPVIFILDRLIDMSVNVLSDIDKVDEKLSTIAL